MELSTALIYGHSIRSSIGLANIRKIIGVCPQVDLYIISVELEYA